MRNPHGIWAGRPTAHMGGVHMAWDPLAALKMDSSDLVDAQSAITENYP